MEKLKSWMTWPIAAVLIAGAVCFAAIVMFAPPETQTLLFGANGLVWSIVAAYLRSPRDAGPLVALLGVFALGATLTGCMSQVRAHATAATIATVALASYGDAVESATEAALVACEQDAAPDACIDRVEHAAERAAAAHDAVRPLVGAYRDAIETGAIAGDDPSVLDTLLVLARRVAREWPTLVEPAEVFGVPVPAFAVPGGGS